MRKHKIRSKDYGAISKALAAHKGGCWRRLTKEVGERAIVSGPREGETSVNNLVVPVYDEIDGGGYRDENGERFDTDLADHLELKWLRGMEVEMLDDDDRIVLDVYLYYPRNHWGEGNLIGNAEVILDTSTCEARIGRVIADFG